MQLENLTHATNTYNNVSARCKKNGRVSMDDMQALEDIKLAFGVTIGECEVFADVLSNKDIELKVRDAILEVYRSELLKLKTDYLNNHESKKYIIADDIMDLLE